MKKIEYIITGMRCQACASSVNNKVEHFKGVDSHSLNLLSGILEVTVSDDFNENDLLVAINSLGFKAVIKNDNKFNFEQDNYFKLYQLIILIIFGIILMYVSMVNMLMEDPFIFDFLNMHINPIGFAVSLLVLSLPIFIIGFKFYIPGLKFLFKLHPNMDSLVSIASITSFIYSFVYTVLVFIYPNNHDYGMNLIYEASSIVIVLVYLGKYIEQQVKNKAKKSINNLVNIIPINTTKVSNDGKYETICVNEIKIDDILYIKKGERIPVDGVIIYGNAELDVSSITGESNLKNVKIDDNVLAGSIISEGNIQIKAIKISSDATINNILALVSKSQLSKSKTSKLVDRISLFFVPITLFISLIVFIVWASIQPDYSLTMNMFINTLVIACPCAIGLATPLANVISSLKALKMGFVFKNMDIISKVKTIDTVIFDKTGTLTTGRFDVRIESIYDESKSEAQILQLVASMEQHLNHPIADSFLRVAKDRSINLFQISNINNLVGLGISAIINDKKYYFGNKKMLKTLGVSTYYIESGTTLYLVEDNIVIAKILLIDQIQEGVVELIQYLKSNRIRTIMLTGDNKSSATYIANKLGIDEFHYSLLPSQKYEILEEIKKNSKVMFIGDGINDAPSLSLSDVSIAPYMSSDIANDSSDIYLLSNNFKNIINVFKLAKYTQKVILMNIIWAFVYNIIAMIFASGVFFSLNIVLEPWMSAAAMSLSSISVVITSLTIKFIK